MTSAYTVTITRTDGTTSSYRTSQSAAYRLINAEISNPSPEVTSVDIRPAVTGK